MRVAVTGGTGFIGRRVVRQLRERGHSVVCVVRRPEKAGALEALGATLSPGDILDRASLDRAFAGCEGVIHLAASYEIGLVGRAAEHALAQNLDGTRHTLEAARDAGATRIVYTSSIVAVGNTRGAVVNEDFRPERVAFPDPHPTRYALSKARAHYEVVEPLVKAGVPIITLMPGAVLGPRDASTFHVIFQFLAAGLPVTTGGAVYPAVGVEDCALAHVLALERGTPGRDYLLTVENLALQDVVARTVAATGIRGRSVRLPDWLLGLSSAFVGLVERVLPVPPVFSSESLRAVRASYTLAFDSVRAREELGWEPRPLDDVFREIVADELSLRGKPRPPQLAAVTPRLE